MADFTRLRNGDDFVESKTATRLWNACKEAGRPWPTLDEDDVIDFMIMEAVAIKSRQQSKEVEQAKERKDWRNDSSGLDDLRRAASTT